MSTLRFVRAALVVAVMAALAASAHAQAVTGSISGTVVDEQGGGVPGAPVTALNERSGATRADRTDTRGDFVFTAMPPGTYTVRAEMSNFRTVQQKGNVLTPSSRLSVGIIKLTVGRGESVVVEAAGNRV